MSEKLRVFSATQYLSLSSPPAPNSGDRGGGRKQTSSSSSPGEGQQPHTDLRDRDRDGYSGFDDFNSSEGRHHGNSPAPSSPFFFRPNSKLRGRRSGAGAISNSTSLARGGGGGPSISQGSNEDYWCCTATFFKILTILFALLSIVFFVLWTTQTPIYDFTSAGIVSHNVLLRLDNTRITPQPLGAFSSSPSSSSSATNSSVEIFNSCPPDQFKRLTIAWTTGKDAMENQNLDEGESTAGGNTRRFGGFAIEEQWATYTKRTILKLREGTHFAVLQSGNRVIDSTCTYNRQSVLATAISPQLWALTGPLTIHREEEKEEENDDRDLQNLQTGVLSERVISSLSPCVASFFDDGKTETLAASLSLSPPLPLSSSSSTPSATSGDAGGDGTGTVRMAVGFHANNYQVPSIIAAVVEEASTALNGTRTLGIPISFSLNTGESIASTVRKMIAGDVCANATELDLILME